MNFSREEPSRPKSDGSSGERQAVEEVLAHRGTQEGVGINECLEVRKVSKNSSSLESLVHKAHGKKLMRS